MHLAWGESGIFDVLNVVSTSDYVQGIREAKFEAYCWNPLNVCSVTYKNFKKVSTDYQDYLRHPRMNVHA